MVLNSDAPGQTIVPSSKSVREVAAESLVSSNFETLQHTSSTYSGWRVAEDDKQSELREERRTPDVNFDSYVKGSISVAFHTGIREEDADKMFKSYGLEYKANFPKLFSYWIKVEKGAAEDYLNKLNKSQIVLWAKERGKPHSDPTENYILVQFNLLASGNSADALIESIDGLVFYSVNKGGGWARVRVPVGSEDNWVLKFERHEIVKSVSRVPFVELLQ